MGNNSTKTIPAGAAAPGAEVGVPTGNGGAPKRKWWQQLIFVITRIAACNILIVNSSNFSA